LWGTTTTALAGWAPGLLTLVDGAEAGSVTGFPYLAVDPDTT